MEHYQLVDVLDELGLSGWQKGGQWPSCMLDGMPQYEGEAVLALSSPIDGQLHGELLLPKPARMVEAIVLAELAWRQWRQVPAPRRGELVKAIGRRVVAHKQALARLLTLETGKTASEAAGEVQEWIDLCDLALGQSRQLSGQVIASERPEHRLIEQWHPLGVIGVITPFNLPFVAWAAHVMPALVCGNAVVWKPSEKAPLCALAAMHLAEQAMQETGVASGVLQVVLGGRIPGEVLAGHPAVALLGMTGATSTGQQVAATLAARLGRGLLALGANNALVVTPQADLEQAVRAIVFATAGSSGQRCTSLRRLIVHEQIADQLCGMLIEAFEALPIGDPRDPQTLVGPLIDAQAVQAMKDALLEAQVEGGVLLCGGKVVVGIPVGHYVQPALMMMPHQSEVMLEEHFAPLLFVVRYRTLEEAIALNNAVPQGLSSAIFTNDLREAERFIGACGSDCGMVNVNAGPSGAEIGSALGGEKASGGGRIMGADAWKNYMRRCTSAINYSYQLPLAQGVRFDKSN